MDANAEPPQLCTWPVQRAGGEEPCGRPIPTVSPVPSIFPRFAWCTRHQTREFEARNAVFVMLSHNVAGFALVLERLVEQGVLTWQDIARVAKAEELLSGRVGALY